jgi:hypothetical protein
MARAAKLLLDLSGSGQQPIDRREHSNHELAARIAIAQILPEKWPDCFHAHLNHDPTARCTRETCPGRAESVPRLAVDRHPDLPLQLTKVNDLTVSSSYYGTFGLTVSIFR